MKFWEKNIRALESLPFKRQSHKMVKRTQTIQTKLLILISFLNENGYFSSNFPEK